MSSTILPVTRSDDLITQRGTLRWAIANAQSGDTILLTPAAGKTAIMLTQGELIVSQQGLTIESVANASAMIGGSNLSRIFEIAPGASVTLLNVHITGGNGSADNPAGDASQDGSGGAILVDGGAALTVDNSTFSGNAALFRADEGYIGGSGGAIDNNNGTLTVNNCFFFRNFAVGAFGWGFGGAVNNSGAANINGSSFSGNSAPDGGAIENYYGGTLTVKNCDVSNNSATSYFDFGAGGGIQNAGALTFADGTISGNTADAQGGGIDNSGGTATVTDSTISGNGGRVAYGGGIANGGTLVVSGCNLSANSARYSGGGISSGGTTTINACTLSGNSSQYGGGICSARSLFVSGSTLLDNSAFYGGGIYLNSGGILHGLTSGQISGSTLSGNSASFGGGIFNEAAQLAISGSTLSGNSATQAGGGLYNDTSYFYGVYPGTVTLTSSTSISGNTGPIGFGADVYNLGLLYADGTSIGRIGVLNGSGPVAI